jgi:hypothetical protein
MTYTERLSPAQGIIMIGVIGLVLFFVGFFVARWSADRSYAAETSTKVDRDRLRYQFMQVGDTVAAIDVYTGEAFAIDGNTRAWTILAPALPSKDTKNVK